MAATTRCWGGVSRSLHNGGLPRPAPGCGRLTVVSVWLRGWSAHRPWRRYETIGFKVPNLEIDKSADKFYTNWDKMKQLFTLQLFFKDEDDSNKGQGSGGAPRIRVTAPWERIRS